MPNIPEPSKEYAEIELVRHNLQCPSDYIAVSYAWGAPNGVQILEANDGTIVFITLNLWHFLCAQSAALAGKVLWIDQICINQQNLSERASQVSLMSRIFEKASETIIWLGQEDEHTEHSYYCIHKFARIPAHTVRMLRDGTKAYPLERSLVDGPGRHLRDLLARPWFTRLWALQEAVLGTAPRFVCGTQSASWHDFVTAVINTTLVFEIDCPNTIPTMRALRNSRHSGRQIPLVDLLLLTHRDFLCSDSRDRVYALLSMQGSLSDFKVDYAATTKEVYKSVAEALVKSTSSLDILRAVRSNPLRLLANLPSWVPDWRIVSYANDLMENYSFQACKDLIATRHGEVSSNCLKVEGRIIDYVYQIEKPDDVELLVEGAVNRASAQTFLRELPNRVYHGIPETNYTLPKRFEALLVWTILCGHYTLTGDPPNPMCLPIEDWIWRLLIGSDGDSHDEFSARRLWVQVGQTCEGRTLLALEQRTIALGPQSTEVGDVICVLHGSKVPIALRRQGDKWTVVGWCYVDGVMFGEAVTRAEDEAHIFELI